ncbi:hypothetical protein [Bacillus cereus group sp. BfR-BA-01358]|uniref:hypothetical protein n=1 Tax=Bacillus cereus group sp. BfR-BA-01358 TaxID=2920320 RepID=UPI001F58BFF2|nr:hypothetical protein [Bacillus cereus group sp. BfR-BA-01358]
MFTKVLNEKGLRKLAAIGKMLSGVPTAIPSIPEQVEAKKELDERLTGEGGVQYVYAKFAVIGLRFSEEKKHYVTGSLLIKDINEGQKIVLNNYR